MDYSAERKEQVGEPQSAYDVDELISNYKAMPSRYANLDLTVVFENPRWRAAEINEVVELGMTRGATVAGHICVVAQKKYFLRGYASDDVGELLRGTAEKAMVEARVRTLFGSIVDPDSYVTPPDTPWKQLEGLQIKDVVRVCLGSDQAAEREEGLR